MPSIAEHLNWHWKQRRHLRVARAVLATPPLQARDDGVVIFSMVGGKALLPYLVAVKSFAQALGRGRVVVMDDGSLSAADREVLRHHLGGPEIVPIAAVETAPAPRGGTWERLLTILDRRASDYVIQLDSDTLTLGNVAEVRAAIDANRSFTLRGEAASERMTVDAFAASLPARAEPLHIQHAAERAMAGLRVGGAEPCYVRGCSGFAGFARGGGGRDLAIALSQAMERALGAARWSEWGTEQVTSNFVLANDPDPLLLPYDRYRNFWCDGVPAGVGLMHFLGTNRFAGSTYIDLTARVIAGLR